MPNCCHTPAQRQWPQEQTATAWRVVEAQAVLASSKFPHKMSCYWSTLYGAEHLQHWFCLFPSLLLYPSTTHIVPPCSQSAVPTLAVIRMELLAGCAPVQSLKSVIPWMLWLPNSPFLSTQSTLARPVPLSTPKTGNASYSPRCCWTFVIKMSSPLYPTALCIMY